MANTYNWMIASMQCYPEKDGLSDVVFIVNWYRQATDGTHSASVYGAQLIEFVPGSPFTPYEDLMPETVCQWLENAIGQDRILELDAALDAKLAEQKNPQITRPDLPWA